MTSFQVRLGGVWKDFEYEDSKVLKTALKAGHMICWYSCHGKFYEYDFKRMQQRNVKTGNVRQIRPPYRWASTARVDAAEKPPVKVIRVPPGSAGTTIYTAHPKIAGRRIPIFVPAEARDMQMMMVPVPEEDEPLAPSTEEEEEEEEDTDEHPAARGHAFAPPARSPFIAGQQVEYYSATKNFWFACNIIGCSHGQLEARELRRFCAPGNSTGLTNQVGQAS
mmetsp:Transcript_140483/g.244615  ORF Transcript_140483/g.244615 Transcript_140483/m.244615 type:complete len:222 (+) Transcript_140483:71-736(+)